MACSERTLIKACTYFTFACLVALQALLLWHSVSLLLRSPNTHTNQARVKHQPEPDFKLPAPLQRKVDNP